MRIGQRANDPMKTTEQDERAPTAWERLRAHAVHAYTASGVGLAFLAAAEICQAAPDPRRVFGWLFAAVVVDATDGVLARRWEVKRWAASIDGRTIDDLVDYLTFTFLPLLLMWRMDWLPQPGEWFVIPALIASLFGFANTSAKDEAGGYFLGFPSYWNVVAFYAGLLGGTAIAPVTGGVTLFLTVLTILPVRFLYPNLTPRPWKGLVLGGAAIWAAMLLVLLWDYPHSSPWLVWTSLIYPLFYTVLSLTLQFKGSRLPGT